MVLLMQVANGMLTSMLLLLRKRKRGGMNVYVNGRKKKAFFVDGMTDHFDNFIKRMEKEGKEIILPETKEKR